MYSFYGGRPGNSFIIITTYRSIADMVAKFKQGPSYTAVHYDEHVMINTVNKNDPDNGRVYRRGYDFTNTMGGAEYIGTIVGPAGKAPMLEMTTVADVKSKHASEGYDERFSSGQYSPTGGNLVPGKTRSGTFNDAITWACCSIRNENDEDATAYIGFTFPYTVIDYETSWIEPYVAGRYADTSSATRVDDETHPFFEKWHINVPKGVKGNAFMNLKVEAASTNVEEYTGQADDINHGRMILAYDYYNYDDYQNGAPVRLYLGDYNMIDNVFIDDEGTITIDYSHDDDSVWTKKIKWVKSVTLNTETGLLTVVYNHTTDASGNPTTYTTYLDWIDEVNIANDGTVTFGHTHEADTVFSNIIQWVTGVTINNDGTVTFTWNNGTADTVFSNIIQWISSVNLAADGTLTVGYNNGAADSVFNKVVKWISGCAINTELNTGDGEGTGNQKFHITWNDGTEEDVGNPINYIMNMAVNENNHLLVRYSDPARRIGGLTYNSIDGWTDLGQITQQYEYGDGSVVTGLNWIGIGQLIDDGTNNKVIKFNISPAAFINAAVDTVTITAGTLDGTNGIDIVTALDLTTATVTKTLTGLQFEIDSGIASGGAAATGFINLSITGMGLSFSVTPQP